MARHELRKVSQSTYILAAVLCGKPQVHPLIASYNDDGTQTASEPWARTLRTLDLID